MQPRTRVTRYTVCALPEDHPETYRFAVHAEETAPGRWAVTNRALHLQEDGTWGIAPYSARTLAAALDAAEIAAPNITVNGASVADAIANPGSARSVRRLRADSAQPRRGQGHRREHAGAGGAHRRPRHHRPRRGPGDRRHMRRLQRPLRPGRGLPD